MKDRKSLIVDLNDAGTQKNLSHLIDVIHVFSQKIINTQTEQEIFDVLVDYIGDQLALEDCVVYRVQKKTNTIIQVAVFAPEKKTRSSINNRLELKIGEGNAGIVAKTGKSLLISDVSKSKNYIPDNVAPGSELEVPVKINEEVYAVISSENHNKDFYNSSHVKLFEVISSIAIGAIVKIQEATKQNVIKEKLEGVLEKKSIDLDRAIDTLSSQYSTLKYEQDKQETLIQEIHHRVNNNLQVISSILRLYINSNSDNRNCLPEIYNRIQAMGLIHQNIYRSKEMNLVDINAYLRDLLNYLRSTDDSGESSIDIDVKFHYFSLDTLVPLGLFLTDIYYFWKGKMKENDVTSTSLQLSIKKDFKISKYELLLTDQSNKQLFSGVYFQKEEHVSEIMMMALIDQLDGEMSYNYDNGNGIRLLFS